MMLSKMTNIAVGIAILLSCSSPVVSQSIVTSDKSARDFLTIRSTNPIKDSLEGGTAHVYLLRGLMNFFSFGMDDLAQKLERVGVTSSVYSYIEWQQLSEEIVTKYKIGNHGAIIMIGHSLGADSVMLMGEQLGTSGVPVALIVLFDGTRSFAVTENVDRVMNITQHIYITRGPGFRGELANIDLSGDPSINHLNIDKSTPLHVAVINKINSVIGGEDPTKSDSSRSSRSNFNDRGGTQHGLSVH